MDLRKPYDSVSSDVYWVVLQRRYLIPEKQLKILKVLHRETRKVVRVYGKVSKEFPSRMVYGREMCWLPFFPTPLTQSFPWQWYNTQAVG